MKPFVLEFKETPIKESLDYSLIEYSKVLNLSIIKNTGKPAVDFLNMDTSTATRGSFESSDSDKPSLNKLLDTTTFTKAGGETSGDKDDGRINYFQMDTSTQTFTATEASDSDRDRRMIELLLDTSTLTESRETTDQDK